MIAEPPLDNGASHLAVAVTDPPSAPRTAVPILGADGRGRTTGAIGVTAADRAENAPVPIALVAVSWNRYCWPLVSPVTTSGLLVAGRSAPTWAPAALMTRTE